ncbi:hypothetical protein CSKR_110613 [Clonorchis sinensis]|uniref:Uncharacterized protein n=1 Tax=Clonorchis sinensis TaxID=79923 RepID=A0A419PKS2_CLOSI|nr:hypothetical protein CSKR_110613 [Clonorchis sinensis]
MKPDLKLHQVLRCRFVFIEENTCARGFNTDKRSLRALYRVIHLTGQLYPAFIASVSAFLTFRSETDSKPNQLSGYGLRSVLLVAGFCRIHTLMALRPGAIILVSPHALILHKLTSDCVVTVLSQLSSRSEPPKLACVPKQPPKVYKIY